MSFRIKNIGIIILGLCLLSIGYTLLMLHYKSADPIDLVYYSLKNTWCVDSVLVEREYQDFPLPVLGKGECSFTVSVYATNNVRKSFIVDSVKVIDVSTGTMFSPILPYILLRSSKKENDNSIIHNNTLGKSSFIIPSYIHFYTEKSQELLNRAFENRTMEIIIFTSRGQKQIKPSSFITKDWRKIKFLMDSKGYDSSMSTPSMNLPLWMRGGSSGKTKQISFIENGKYLVSQAINHFPPFVSVAVHVYDMSSGKLIQARYFNSSNSAISHYGEFIALSTRNSDYACYVHINDFKRGTELKNSAAPNEVNGIVFSNDDKLIAVCGMKGFVFTWEVESGKILRSYQGFTIDVEDVKFSPDDKYIIASGAEDKQGEIKIWNTETGDLKLNISANPGPYAISPDGKSFAYCESSDSIALMDFATGKIINHYYTKGKYSKTLSFSPDSKSLLLGSTCIYNRDMGDEYENTLLLIKTDDIGSPMELMDNSSIVLASTFTPDGNFIVCCLNNGGIPLWDTKTGSMLRKDIRRTSNIKTAGFSLDGKSVITFGSEGDINTWDAMKGDSVSTSICDDKFGYLKAVSISKGLIALCKAYEGRVYLISVHTGKVVKTLLSNKDEIFSINFSYNGDLLSTSGSDGDIYLWETTTGKLLNKYKLNADTRVKIAFSVDGTHFAAVAKDNKILILNINSKKEPIDLSLKENQHPQGLMFSNDGKYLAVNYSEGPIQIWNISNRLVEKNIANNVTSLTYSPDGNYMAVANPNGTVDIWNINADSLVTKFNTPSDAYYVMLQWSPKSNFLLGLTYSNAVVVWDVSKIK